MKIADLKQMTEEELHDTLAELRLKMSEVRFKILHEDYKNVRELRNLKKDIARVITVLRSK